MMLLLCALYDNIRICDITSAIFAYMTLSMEKMKAGIWCSLNLFRKLFLLVQSEPSHVTRGPKATMFSEQNGNYGFIFLCARDFSLEVQFLCSGI